MLPSPMLNDCAERLCLNNMWSTLHKLAGLMTHVRSPFVPLAERTSFSASILVDVDALSGCSGYGSDSSAPLSTCEGSLLNTNSIG